MQLSVLIPITPDRKEIVVELLSKLGCQMSDNTLRDDWWRTFKWKRDDNLIEVVMIQDNKEMTIGEKREQLYQLANGIYSWQIDSDDDISTDAIDLILKAIKETPDCITFQEKCVINGQYFSSNHSLKYDMWRDNHDGFNFTRSPFYKDVIKTEIAKSVPFPHIRWNEDEQWSMRLYPYLKNEIHIDKELYYYIHNSKPEEHNIRYGYDRD